MSAGPEVTEDVLSFDWRDEALFARNARMRSWVSNGLKEVFDNERPFADVECGGDEAMGGETGASVCIVPVEAIEAAVRSNKIVFGIVRVASVVLGFACGVLEEDA